MTTMTDDATVGAGLTAVPRFGSGAVFALASALAFGSSGALARGLLDAGWSAGAIVVVRVLGGALVLLVPGLLALGGRWQLLRSHGWVMAAYGLIAVALTQLCYFSAVRSLPVGVALLIESTAPVAVIGWMWARHGQRPGPLTAVGTVLAGVGLVLVLDLLGQTSSLDLTGVLWALGAMAGLSVYFVLSADEDIALPPVTLAAGGMLFGGVCLLLAGLVGIVPLAASTAPAHYAHGSVPWWVPMVLLAVVTAALAYLTGIGAGRRLGSRLASFFALLEVVFAVTFAWLLLGQTLLPAQLVGGVVILAGIAVVRLGEIRVARTLQRAATAPEHHS